MSQPVRSWIALGVVLFVGAAAVRPAIAQTAPPAANAAPAAPPANTAAPPPAAAPYPPQGPPQGYPPPGYPPPGYPPPGYPPSYGATPPPGYGAYPQPYATYPASPPLTLQTVHRPRRGLVTAGAITFGVSWGIAATISLLLNDSSCVDSCSDTADYLWIPVAGPMILAFRDSNSGGESFFVLWSAAQAAGLIMFVVGLIGHDVQEYRVAQRGPSLSLAPMFARGSGGMGLTARW